MRSIDERIVEMRFDNKQFESGVDTTLKSLSKLKEGLKLDKAVSGLSELDRAAKGFSLSNVANAADIVAKRFSTMGIIGTTQLQRIANKALDTTERILSAFTTQPVSTGFAEYETQINAVQTILSNTKKEGATLEDVNRTLDELNTYADKTIYNFTEMTRNIGTFTAAGVDLKTSTSAIKGIANLAAISGSTSQQASTAMYQLSQALASGTIKLMDWNSVVNAGMGGAVFQDALKETARIHGIKIDEMIKEEGSFRETLQKGWLTSAILTETLQKFTGDLSKEQLKALGYTEQQAQDIYELGQDANNAATKVKTFTQLFDTLKEAAQSGWSQSWRIVVGDFEEARTLLTEVSNAFGAVIDKTSESRNLVLAQWKDLGGRTALIESFKNVFAGLSSILTSVKAAFHSIFPPTTGQDLKNLTDKVKNATEKFKALFWHKEGYTATAVETSEGVMLEKDAFYQFSPMLQKFVKVFKGVFSVARIAIKGITKFGAAVLDVVTYCKPAFTTVLDILGAVGDVITNIATLIADTAHIGDWSVDFKNSIKPIIEVMPKASKAITGYIKSVGDYIKESGIVQNGIGKVRKVFGDLGTITLTALDSISKFVTGIWEYLKTNETFKQWLETAKTSIKNFGTQIGEFYTKLITSLKEFVSMDPEEYDAFIETLKAKFEKMKQIGDIPSAVAQWISEIWSKASENLKTAGETLYNAAIWVKDKVVAVVDFLGQFGISLQKLGGGFLLIAVAKFVLSLLAISKAISSVIGSLGESLGSLTGTLAEFAKNKFIKKDTIGTTLLKIAGSIGLLVGAIWLLSTIDAEKIKTGSVLLIGISAGLLVMVKALDKLSVAKASDFEKQTDALMRIAGSVIVLTGAIWLLGGMNTEKLGRGITALGGILAELSGFLVLTKGAGYSLATNFFTLAIAIAAMTYAVKTFAQMESMGAATKGLGVLGLLLGELGTFMKLTTGTGFAGATSFFGLAAVLTAMVKIIKQAADIEVGDGAKGLTGIAAMLTELGIFMKIANGSSFKGGLNLIGMAIAMNMLVPALEKMGTLDLITLAQGVGSLSTLLLGIGGAMRLMSGFSGGFSSIIGVVVFAGALTIFADAMDRLIQLPGGKMVLASGAFAAAIGSFSASFGILSAMPATMALNGIVTIAIAIGGIAAIISAMAAISRIPGFDWAMSEGGDALGKIGSAIGKFIQGILKPDGVTTSTQTDTSMFEKIGSDLNSLITNLQPFFDSVKNIDESVVTGVTNMGSILNTLIGASFWDRLLAWGDDTSAIEGFSKSLIPFGQNMVTYADTVSSLDTESITKSASAAQMLADFATTISPSRNVIAELLTGENNLESFASGLAALGPSLKTYAENVAGIDNDAVTKSANAAGLLVDFAVELNNSTTAIDTIVGKMTGTNSISTFAEGLKSLGPSLNTYANDIKDIKWTSVIKSANAAKLLSEFAVNLNNSTSPIDAIITYFTGESSITTFAEGLKELGPTLKQYATDVAGIDANAVENSANAAKLLVDFEKELSAEGGAFNAIKSWLAGDKDLITFSEKLVTFGQNMSTFASTFSSENTTIPDAVATVGGLLKDLSSIFGTGEDSLKLDYSSVSNLGAIMLQLTDELVWYAPYFDTSGETIMVALSNGMSRVTNVLPAAMSDLMQRCLAVFNNYYYHFYTSGGYIIQGLASGMSANAYLAAYAAANVASRALLVFNRTLGINSPAKEFIKSGMYSDKGIAVGFMKYAYIVDDAAKKVGNRAISVMSTALRSIDSIVNSDLTINPVITPVIDASQIASGMNAVNGMFGNRMINVGGINAGVLNRTAAYAAAGMGQNGFHSVNESARVAQAIDNLNGRMDEMTQTISRLKVVLDSGATVGQLKSEFNRQMGRQMTYDERGM